MKKEWYTIHGFKFISRCPHARDYGNGYIVPCGKCFYCRKKLANDWGFRLTADAHHHFHYNVLLTYRDEDLDYHKGKPSLNKVHIQEFLKRFRYYMDKLLIDSVRYFVVGEYGGKYHRPHYHMVLMTNRNLISEKMLEIVHSLIELAWRKGFCNIEPMRSDDAAGVYLIAYSLVNNISSKEFDCHNRPFRLMSKMPGIGIEWIQDNSALVKKMIYEQEFMYGYTRKDGARGRRPIPRYYRDKLIDPIEKLIQSRRYQRECDEYKSFILNLTEDEKRAYNYEVQELRRILHKRDIEQYRINKVNKCGKNARRLPPGT